MQQTESRISCDRELRVKATRGTCPEHVHRLSEVLKTPNPTDQEHHADACLQFFVETLRARRLDPKTISAYMGDIACFRRTVDKDLLEVGRADVQRAIANWKDKVADGTTQRRVAALRKFFDLLFSAGLISTRPLANLRLPKAWSRVLRPPATEDLERVIAAIGRDSPFDVRDLALLLILRDTGPRAMAISQLELANVDWELGRVLLLHDKFGKEHWVSLSKRSTTELRHYIETARPYFLHGRDLPYLFLSGKRDGHNGPISRQRVWQIATYWTKRVLGVPWSPHGWRRACLTEGAALGMDTFDLMNLAGHSSPDTTQRYIHHPIDHLKKTVAETHPRARKKQK